MNYCKCGGSAHAPPEADSYCPGFLLNSSDFEKSGLCCRSQRCSAERRTLRSSDVIRCVCVVIWWNIRAEQFWLPLTVPFFEAFFSYRRADVLMKDYLMIFHLFCITLYFYQMFVYLKISSRCLVLSFTLLVNVCARWITSVCSNIFIF